jgi:hypothetical protein
MSVFVDRSPTPSEIERLRLVLSTYQDGSGMIKTSLENFTLPGWRDFERACALTFNGITVENKFFVDVIFPFVSTSSFYGIDCKMKRELRTAESKGRIYVEVTNASKLLWSYLYSKGVTESNFRNEPELAGNSLVEAIEILKKSSSLAYPSGLIEIERSYYFVLLWNTDGFYCLYQLPLALPLPQDLIWKCHVSKRSDGTETTRLVGVSLGEILYEWYGESGGQFKYYPPVSSAVWVSERFQLEPLPDFLEHGLLAKARAYFPNLWDAANE